MMIKTLYLMLALCLLMPSFVFASGVGVYWSFAEKNSPLLMATDRAAKAAEADAASSGFLADPVVGFKASNYPINDPSMGNTPMTANTLSISQKFPFPGKLNAESRAASLSAGVARAKAAEASLELRQMVASQYYKTSQLFERLEYLKKQLMVFESLMEIVKGRYLSGKVNQSDVLRTMTEKAEVEIQLADLDGATRESLVRLNVLCGIDVSTPFRGLNIGTRLPSIKLADDLYTLAVRLRPELRSARLQVDRSKAMEHLASLESQPDFTITAAYSQRAAAGQDPGDDFVSLGVSVNLPIWSEKYSSRVAGANHRSASQEYLYREIERSIQEEIESAVVRLQSTRLAFEIYEEKIVPQTKQIYDALLGDYEAGKNNIESVINGLNKIFSVHMGALKQREKFFSEIVRLERLVGAPLKDLRDE